MASRLRLFFMGLLAACAVFFFCCQYIFHVAFVSVGPSSVLHSFMLSMSHLELEQKSQFQAEQQQNRELFQLAFDPARIVTAAPNEPHEGPVRSESSELKVCPLIPKKLVGRLKVDKNEYPWAKLNAVMAKTGSHRFNRAMLFNVGFIEASKDYHWDCYIFHDVDLLFEDDRNLYSCPDEPRHMSVAIDKFKYRLPYNEIFGGVSAMTRKQFVTVNGFSNQFWGWGGEDDDMWNRIKYHNMTVRRYKPDVARYTMIKHHKAEKNDERSHVLKQGKRRFQKDGLNNLMYNLMSIELHPLFTEVRVALFPVRVATRVLTLTTTEPPDLDEEEEAPVDPHARAGPPPGHRGRHRRRHQVPLLGQSEESE